MNKNLAIAGALGGALCAFCLTVGWPSFSFGRFSSRPCGAAGVESSGRELPWTGGNAVSVEVPGKVVFRAGPQWRARVTGPSDVVDHLVFENGSLHFDRWLEQAWTGRCRGDLRIELTGPAVERWELHGSGELNVQGLDQSELNITVGGSASATVGGKVERTRANVRGSGDLDLSGLVQNEIDLDIRGSGSVQAAGQVRRTRVTVAGSGDARLHNLTTQDADISISGSGNVDLAPEGRVDVQIKGSGNLRLAKKPQSLQARIHGSGRVI